MVVQEMLDESDSSLNVKGLIKIKTEDFFSQFRPPLAHMVGETSRNLTSYFNFNCWPSENADGGCDVNIEYELEHEHMELNDVSITIPLPIGCTPVISDCDGEYNHDSRKNILIWTLPIIDSSNKSGYLEFSAPSSVPSDFFPLNIDFSSKNTFAVLKITDVQLVEDDTPVKHSVETVFIIDKYEIV